MVGKFNKVMFKSQNVNNSTCTGNDRRKYFITNYLMFRSTVFFFMWSTTKLQYLPKSRTPSSQNLSLPNPAETLPCFEATDGFLAAGEWGDGLGEQGRFKIGPFQKRML